MLIDTPASSNPIEGILLVGAVWGAVVDWHYKRRGGKRSTKREWVMFLLAVGLVAVLFVALALIGANREALGAGLFDVAVLLFSLWELWRWRVRRNSPLQM